MADEYLRSFDVGELRVRVYGTEEEVGAAAAVLVGTQLRAAIEERGAANLLLATGASQFAFLAALKEEDIAWHKITIFHLDEYVGLSEHHPASFRKYLNDRILRHVKPRAAHLIRADAEDLVAEISAYETLFKQHPVDVACIGIGENGHIAFNDPPVADFEDPKWVKEVELDEACRMQQVNEGWYASLEEVPKRAVTLTIPAIMKSRLISCVVPGERKVDAVNRTLYGPLSTECPASILRSHDNATLFLDSYSAKGAR